jgi:hypothetical protein
MGERGLYGTFSAASTHITPLGVWGLVKVLVIMLFTLMQLIQAVREWERAKQSASRHAHTHTT